MAISSPRLRRLDGALAALPAESDAMMLSDLDGYLAGLIVCPERVPPEEWLPLVWSGSGDPPPFEDEREAQWYAGLVIDHRDAIVAALNKGVGRWRPFLEIDVARDEVLWELWISGFASALTLRPDSWSALRDGDDAGAAEALDGLATLVDIAEDANSLERSTIDRLTDEAPDLIPRWIETLYARRRDRLSATDPAAPQTANRTGRNDPCPCGSGRKHKKCCGTS